jgi:hypothetical protein
MTGEGRRYIDGQRVPIAHIHHVRKSVWLARYYSLLAVIQCPANRASMLENSRVHRRLSTAKWKSRLIYSSRDRISGRTIEDLRWLTDSSLRIDAR